MLDRIKLEQKQRKREEAELYAKLEQKKQQVREKRESKKKNVFRKIKFVDSAYSKSERKQDEKEIADFEKELRNHLDYERKTRKRQLELNYSKDIWQAIGLFFKKTYKIIGVLLLLLIVVSIATTIIQEKRETPIYNAAVEYVLDEEYKNAKDCLTDIEIEDSSELLSYCKLQLGVEKYIGKTDDFLKKLESCENITNDDIKDQVKENIKAVEYVEDVQKTIDKINVETIDVNNHDEIEELEDKISNVDEKYQILLDTTNYEEATKVLENIENETNVGKTIVAIREIGTVSLESEECIGNARNLYNSLTETEKNEVVNLTTLTKAESTLKHKKEVQEKKEKEEAEAKKKAEEQAAAEAQKEAEEQAALEEQQATETQRALGTQQDADNVTVYITNTGKCYHLEGCSYLKSKKPISKKDAIASGYSPCSRCHPG